MARRKKRNLERKVKDGLVRADLFGFLTCEPNGIVGPVHQKAMPVVLRTPEEVETWLEAPWEEAKRLQRSLPDGELIRLPQVEDPKTEIESAQPTLL